MRSLYAFCNMIIFVSGLFHNEWQIMNVNYPFIFTVCTTENHTIASLVLNSFRKLPHSNRPMCIIIACFLPLKSENKR